MNHKNEKFIAIRDIEEFTYLWGLKNIIEKKTTPLC